MTLLHYIALIVKEKYPELANFYNELHFVDKAAAGEFRPGIMKICLWKCQFNKEMSRAVSSDK